LFQKSNVFGSCIIHILYTGCAKIKKNNSGAKRLIGTASHPDIQKIWKLDFSLRKLHWQFLVLLLLFAVCTNVQTFGLTPDLNF